MVIVEEECCVLVVFLSLLVSDDAEVEVLCVVWRRG